jgi:hypothetical protein
MQAMLMAVTREVSSTMEALELTHFARQTIDTARARRQHAACRRRLASPRAGQRPTARAAY